MNIVIASDHGGLELKEQIKSYYAGKGVALDDVGTYSFDSCDYPDIAAAACNKILRGDADWGILICGTGIGISIAANRFKGIRAALLYSEDVARLAKEHNNANVVVFGGRTMRYEDVITRLEAFENASFGGERHQRRIDKLDLLGEK